MTHDFANQLSKEVKKVLSDEANADAWQKSATEQQASLIHHFVSGLRGRIQAFEATSFSNSDEIKVLRFLGDLAKHVETDSQAGYRSPFNESYGRLTHQSVGYAIASRLLGVAWRGALKSLHEKGYIENPAEVISARVVSGGEVTDVLTDIGRSVLQKMER